MPCAAACHETPPAFRTDVFRGSGEEHIATSTLPGKVFLGAVLLFALAASLLRLGTPFAVVGRPAFLEGTYRAVLGYISRSRLERIDRGVMAYHLAKGRPPETLSDVVRADLLDAGALRDPWARPYHYILAGNGYGLSSDDTTQPPIARVLPAAQP